VGGGAGGGRGRLEGFVIVPAVLSPRKHKISRLEEFSDAVFGFALTLLALSSGVPDSYTALITVLKGVPAFACSFALIVWIWHEHDTFFERYPLEDERPSSTACCCSSCWCTSTR
jgi:uncharacterized membrane protein